MATAGKARNGGAGDALAQRLMRGEVRALARGITLVESGREESVPLLRAVYPHTGRATTVGVTGFPGAGKSSLVDRLIESYRARNKTVGVVAVDPSSAFSGGAILGDRVRMMRHTGDEGTFIRSMATRGHLGGLARTTGEVIDLIDASGRDVVLIETVGVGQDEISIASLADVVVVVLVPGMGDDIQAIKAGILEIADLFVINKADREGADRLAAELTHMMGLVEDASPRAPILKTVAIRGEGIEALAEAIGEQVSSPEMGTRRADRRRRRADARLRDLFCHTLLGRTMHGSLGREGWARLVEDLAERRVDPHGAVERLMAHLPERGEAS